jgi:hypothetical protein
MYERTSQVSCAKNLTTICTIKTLKYAQLNDTSNERRAGGMGLATK